MKFLRRKRFLGFVLAVLVLTSSASVFASSTEEVSEAYTDLGNLLVLGKETTSSGVSLIDPSKSYTTTGGGYTSYSSLVNTSNPNTGYVVEGNFELLTASAKREFLTDIIYVAESATSANADITSDTMTVWTQSMQTCNGVDSQLIPVLMGGTKPDFVSAMRIYGPFQSPIGTILGVLTLIFFALLTFSTLIDLFYIGNPIFNSVIQGDNKEKPGIVSAAAYKAYLDEIGQSGNTSANGKSSFKSAAGIYFKHRVVTLVLLFICILYLVSGQIWDLVGDAMSLFEGMK